MKVGCTVIFLISISVVVIALRVLDPFGYDEIASKLRRGMAESEVRQAMNREPSYVYDRETAPQNYYVDGWSYRERPITGKVWIYMCGEPICYIWFNREGFVEDFFVGGS